MEYSKESTTNLLNILDHIKDDKEAEKFASEHASFSTQISFSEFFNQYIAENNLVPGTLVSKAGLPKSTGNEIINGKKKTPGRDKVIALCLVAGMNRKNTSRALELSGNNALSPKNQRDLCIIICINNDNRNIVSVNNYLDEKGFEPLNV